MTREHLFINQYYWLILLLVLVPFAFFDFTLFYYGWLVPVVCVQFSINLQNYLGHMQGFGAYRTYDNATSGNSQNRLDGLVDVYEGGDPEDGSTLVYDKTNDKYIVRKLPVGDIDGNFDGGSF
jgi:hypothetical protein